MILWDPQPEHLFQLLIAGVRNDFPALRAGAESAPALQLPGRARELAAVKRRERLSGAHLKAYDRALEWAQMGTNGADELMPVTAEATKNPA